jgi:LPXTG-motif cell wall-anchored protein
MNLQPSMSRRAVPPAALAAAVLALGVAGPAHAVSGTSDSSVTAVSAQYAKSTPPPPQQASAPSQVAPEALPEDEQVTLPAVQEPDEGATPLPEDEAAPIAQAAQESGGGSDLPNTGFTIAAIALLGAALLTGGLALRRTASRIPA